MLVLLLPQGFHTKTIDLMACQLTRDTSLSLSRRGPVNRPARQAEVSDRAGTAQISSVH